MIKDIILVGIGSGIGGICRYLISLAMTQARNGFPWGTFTINVVGCLLIGILWGATSRFQNVSPSFSLFLMVGFCGGFTTFSTFSKEGLTMHGRFLWWVHNLLHILKRRADHATG